LALTSPDSAENRAALFPNHGLVAENNRRRAHNCFRVLEMQILSFHHKTIAAPISWTAVQMDHPERKQAIILSRDPTPPYVDLLLFRFGRLKATI
jgi:hypothetical protein